MDIKQTAKRYSLVATMLWAWVCVSLAAQAQDTSFHVYYGLLHAHTLICDGSGTPEEAYRMAKSAGLQFFAVTPHNHAEAESGAKERKDDVLIAYNHDLYNGNKNVTLTRKWKDGDTRRTEQITIKPLLQAAKEATSSSFVALYGQEFSTISSSNHVNVLGIDHVIEVPNGDFKGLLLELKGIAAQGKLAPVIQLNHPNVSADLFHSTAAGDEEKHAFNDYGIDAGDLGPNFEHWVTHMEPYTHLIEVLSGPAMEKARVDHYTYKSHENDYYFYLRQGLHVSPSAGQDNHYKTWGAVTDARTGIIAKNLSEASIYDAFRKHRTFVSEDKNMSVVLYLNKEVMGATAMAIEGSELDIKVLIKDADEPNASYDVLVYSGAIAPELSTKATHWKAADGMVEKKTVHGNGMHTIKGVRMGSATAFYYVKVVQNGNDHAWTAPVWVTVAQNNHIIRIASQKYFWSKSASSKVYHLAGCPSVSRINPENVESGTKPPGGRTQHNCKLVQPTR